MMEKLFEKLLKNQAISMLSTILLTHYFALKMRQNVCRVLSQKEPLLPIVRQVVRAFVLGLCGMIN